MIRKGADPDCMRDINCGDIFIMRLHLLVIMSLAYLNDFPLGHLRATAVNGNAKIIAREIIDWVGGEFKNFRSEQETRGVKNLDHVFYQRVRLLSVMAAGFASGNPMGQFRKKALYENIEYICRTVIFSDNLDLMEFLQVA